MAEAPIHSKTAAGHPCSGRGFLLILAAIAGAALLLRLGVWAELGAVNGGRNAVYAPSILTDLATYMKLGHEVAAGEYSGPFYYQPFYYAVFLPACYLVSAGSVGFVIFIQCLLGSVTSFLAGLAGGRLFGKTAGYVAAGFVAISTPLLLYTPYHQNETLQAFNLTLLFYLALLGCERWTLPRWTFAGIVAGIAILTRGNILLFLPVLLAALIWAGRKQRISWKRIAAGTALFLAAVFLLELPFAVRNSRITGRLTGPSTAADAVLALGNSPEAPAGGRDPGLPAGPMEYPEAYRLMMTRAGEGVGVPAQMREWMYREPGAFFELQFRKLLLFWDYREIPNNVSLYGPGGGAEESAILRYLLPGRSLLLLSLGLAGLFLVAGKAYRRRDVGFWLLSGLIVIYWGATALFYILSRFRAPILPLVAVAAGAFVSWAIRRWKLAPDRRKQLLLYGGGGFLAAFWLVGSGYEFYRNNCEAAVLRAVRPEGTVLTGGKTSCRFDYGPLTLGGWTELAMNPGQRLFKRFPGFTAPGEAEWRILAGSAGHIRFRVNGRLVSREIEKPGLAAPKFPVSPVDGGFALELLSFPGNSSLLYDFQRDYGRSQLDGVPLKGEWLIRLSLAEPSRR